MANISRFPHHKLNNNNVVSVQESTWINAEKKDYPQTTCTDNHRGKTQHNNKKPSKSKLNNDPLCPSQKKKKKKNKKNVKSPSTAPVRNCQSVLTEGQQLNNYSTPSSLPQQKKIIIPSHIPSLQNDSFVVLSSSHELPSGSPSQNSASCQNESHQLTFSDNTPPRQNEYHRSSSFSSQPPQHQPPQQFPYQPSQQFPHQPSQQFPHQHPQQFSHQHPQQFSHQHPQQFSHQPSQQFSHQHPQQFSHQSPFQPSHHTPHHQPPHQPLHQLTHQPPQQFPHQPPQQQCNEEMMVQGSDISKYYEIKLPGMNQPILVSKLIVEKKVFEPVQSSSPTELRADQRPVITVNLPRNTKNSLLCEEPWWLSSKGSVAFISQADDDDDNDDNIEGEYESAHAIEIATGVCPLVKLPPHGSQSLSIKSSSRKNLMWINRYNDYSHHNDITSSSINFESEPLVVRLPPKAIPNTRFNIQNLKIETNIELCKDDDDAFFASLGCSTLSTPVSETSTTSFSNTSTYAESANTVFTEEESINDVKHCNSRSPSVLSTLSSEHLSPVLEEDEEEEEFEKVLPVEECQKEMTIEEPVDLEICGNESEDSEQKMDDHEVLEEQEYLLPHLFEIVEQLKKLEPDSDETLRIRRQLERIREENYPESLPLSNKWTMYFSDTSATKTNTRIVSKNKYSSTLNTVFKCNTVPELCSNLREFYSKVKPSDMKTFANLSFFKGDIMPMWEDEVNQKGGRFTLCPSRNRLDSLWDSIILLLAGETIDDNNVICGAVCARRSRGDRVELWLSGNADNEAIDHIRELLAVELGSDMVKNLKYKKHYEKP